MILYDPPSGWRYGFPKPYKPLTPDEPVEVTLVRDGYPAKDAAFGAKHCRYIGDYDELLAPRNKDVQTPEF